MSDAVRAMSPAQATTASYADLAGSEMYIPEAGVFSYTLQCATQNSLYKILASNDGENWVEDTPETAIAAGATDNQGGSALFLWYKVQIKQSVAGGTVAAQGVAK